MDSILLGILLGLSTLLFIGPVFFYLLKSSLENGFKAGLLVAIGIIIGDIICVLLAVYGMGSYFENPIFQKWFASLGAVLLLFFGLNYLLKPKDSSDKEGKFESKKPIIYFINGFLINFINPFVFAVWFGFYTLNISKFENIDLVKISLGITLLTIFITDIIKAYFANKLSQFVHSKKLKIAYKITGIIMLVFSIRLIYTFFKL